MKRAKLPFPAEGPSRPSEAPWYTAEVREASVEHDENRAQLQLYQRLALHSEKALDDTMETARGRWEKDRQAIFCRRAAPYCSRSDLLPCYLMRATKTKAWVIRHTRSGHAHVYRLRRDTGREIGQRSGAGLLAVDKAQLELAIENDRPFHQLDATP